MPNSHDFNSYLPPDKNFVLEEKEIKNFYSYLKSTNVFNVFIDSFDALSSWMLKIKVGIKTDISQMKLATRFNSMFRVGISFSISDSLIRIVEKLTSNINIGTININSTLTFFQRMEQTICNVGVSLEGVVSLKEFMPVTNIIMPNISITVSPSYKVFHLLSEYDADYLNTLDSETLEDLEYTIE